MTDRLTREQVERMREVCKRLGRHTAFSDHAEFANIMDALCDLALSALEGREKGLDELVGRLEKEADMYEPRLDAPVLVATGKLLREAAVALRAPSRSTVSAPVSDGGAVVPIQQMEAEMERSLTTDSEHGTRLVGPHGGLKEKMPNPSDADLADPLFEAIWQATKTWDVNSPAHYVGYCGMNGSHVMLILNAIRSALTAGQMPPAPESVSAWIPVSERLPKGYETVLATDGLDTVTAFIASARPNKKHWTRHDAADPAAEWKPTHWQPLPAAPTE